MQIKKKSYFYFDEKHGQKDKIFKMYFACKSLGH